MIQRPPVKTDRCGKRIEPAPGFCFRSRGKLAGCESQCRGCAKYHPASHGAEFYIFFKNFQAVLEGFLRQVLQIPSRRMSMHAFQKKISCGIDERMGFPYTFSWKYV
jgi:hypothetical protein